MTFRVRVLRFVKRLLNVGGKGQPIGSRRAVSTANEATAGHAEFRAHAETGSGGLTGL
ncbi:MAG: hypothetical protein RIB98_10615 [Acidimicrobiales bacterium]